MMRILYFFSGVDRLILNKSGRKSAFIFALIGFISILFCLSTLLFFYNFFQLKYHWILSSFASLLFVIPLISFYYANLLFTEPRYLSHHKVNQVFLTRLSKFLILVSVFIFIIKVIEFRIYNFSYGVKINSIPEFLIGIVNFNISNKWIWFITSMLILMYTSPFYLKYFLLGEKEYYHFKAKIDYEIIKQEQIQAKELLSRHIQRIHDEHNSFKSINRRKKLEKNIVGPEQYKNEQSKNHLIFLHDWNLTNEAAKK